MSARTREDVLADAREARLPRWAREALSTARHERDRAVRDAEEARLATKPEESTAVLHPYDETPVGLGAARVRFKVGVSDRDEWIDVEVNRDHRGKAYLVLMGGTTLLVAPQVTNVLHVEVGRR